MNSRKRGKAVVRRDVRCIGPGWELTLPAGTYSALIETRHIPFPGGLRSEHVKITVTRDDVAAGPIIIDLAPHCRTGDVEV